MKHTLIMGLCLLAGSLVVANAQDATQQPAPDNTQVNARDKDQAEPTADQQKNNASDRAITQQIRKSIMSDKSLSTYGHNVKVISQNGMVTLKGPVKSEDDKAAIEAKAAAIVGKDKVNDQLEIKSDN